MKYSVIVFMILAALYKGADNDGFKDGNKYTADSKEFLASGADH